MNSKKRRLLATAGLSLTPLIWGFAFVVVKNTVDSVPPIYMLALRFSIALVSLALIFIGKFKKLNTHYLKSGAFLGFFLFCGYALQTIGIQYTTAGKNAFLTTFYVVLVPYFNWFFVKKRPDSYAIWAAFIAIIGIGLLSLQDGFNINFGDILTLGCGVAYAVHIIFIARYTENQDPILLTILQLGFAAIFSWLAAPFMDGTFPLNAVQDVQIFVSLLYLGLFSTMVAFLLQNLCQKYTPPSTAALLLSTEAVFGAGFAIIFLGEVLTFRMIIGCLLILCAVIVSETKLDFIHKKE